VTDKSSLPIQNTNMQTRDTRKYFGIL
jgi:hypothetical protein